MENYRFITIGICHYRFLPHLDGSEADFWMLQRFLRNDFNLSEKQALLFTDSSKLGQGRTIYPNRNNLLKSISRTPNIVFFQGYATQSGDQNYLLPIDADPQNLEETAINLRSLLEKFQPQTQTPALLILDLVSPQLNNAISSQFLFQARQRGMSLIVRFNRFQENQGELASALGDALHYYQDSLTLDLLEFYLRDRLRSDDENPLVILSPSLACRQQKLLPPKANPRTPTIRTQQPQPATIRTKPAWLGQQSAPQFSLNSINFFPNLRRSLKLGAIWFIFPLILLGIILFAFRELRKLTQSSPLPQSPVSQNLDQKVLEVAKIHLKRHQASDFIRAIAELRNIKPGSPLYPEAQKRITFWSQTILEIAQGRAEVGNWQDAIAAASLVPVDQTPLYDISQKSIQDWQKNSPQLPDL